MRPRAAATALLLLAGCESAPRPSPWHELFDGSSLGQFASTDFGGQGEVTVHDGRLQLGTALWKLGKLDEALKELAQAKEDDPRSVMVPITLGAVSIDKGDLDAATANLLGNALQKEPGNPDANFYMAKVKRKRAEYTQAIELMKKAIDHAPRRAEFHFELGNIYMDARKGNEAVDEWKAALADGIVPGTAFLSPDAAERAADAVAREMPVISATRSDPARDLRLALLHEAAGLDRGEVARRAGVGRTAVFDAIRRHATRLSSDSVYDELVGRALLTAVRRTLPAPSQAFDLPMRIARGDEGPLVVAAMP